MTSLLLVTLEVITALESPTLLEDIASFGASISSLSASLGSRVTSTVASSSPDPHSVAPSPDLGTLALNEEEA